MGIVLRYIMLKILFSTFADAKKSDLKLRKTISVNPLLKLSCTSGKSFCL